jgi:hypothetical protein
MQLASLEEARTALKKLDLDKMTVEGAWSVAQVLAHCAQSIEYSLGGFPRNKPWIFRATVGKIVLGKFLRQGYMRHNRLAAIPGAPPPDAPDVKAALERLFKAIDDFQARDQFAMHFAYGPVAKTDYDRVQAMHIADHVSSFV